MSNFHPPSPSIRKERIGFVISDKMDKTIVVRVDRRVRHPRFEKVMTVASRFYAHDEKNEAKMGDRVRITETRPLSRLKRWRLVEVVEKGAVQVVKGGEELPDQKDQKLVAAQKN